MSQKAYLIQSVASTPTFNASHFYEEIMSLANYEDVVTFDRETIQQKIDEIDKQKEKTDEQKETLEQLQNIIKDMDDIGDDSAYYQLF